MSEIDSYRHECMGIVKCPSQYNVLYSSSLQLIPLYMLHEDGLDAESWQAKCGDLLLGGGSGESAALRISMPEAIYFFTYLDWDDYESLSDVCCAYWNMNEAYIFCDGYNKLGWSPKERIELWLTEHILSFISQEYPEVFIPWAGPVHLNKDGSIVRLPTYKEKKLL